MKEPHAIVREMLVTEKSTRLTEKSNQYCFKVDRSANKIDIKNAIEQLFKVHVVRVNTMRRIGKKRRERTMNFGRTAGTKRAIVTLKQGESIDLA